MKMPRSCSCPSLAGPSSRTRNGWSVIDRGWKRLDPQERERAIELLFAQPELLDRAEPPAKAIELLRRAATDPSARVRERTLAGVSALPTFWSSRTASASLLFALADDTPAIRKLGLTLSATKSTFWKRPDAIEHLARLLVDPDATVRSEALELVKHHRLGRRSTPSWRSG